MLSLDALTLGADQQTLTVYLWSHGMLRITYSVVQPVQTLFSEDFVFKSTTSFEHPHKIYNVVPGDFTHSGKLDLLVMAQSSTSNQIDLSLYPSLPGGGFGASPSGFPSDRLTKRQIQTIRFPSPHLRFRSLYPLT